MKLSIISKSLIGVGILATLTACDDEVAVYQAPAPATYREVHVRNEVQPITSTVRRERVTYRSEADAFDPEYSSTTVRRRDAVAYGVDPDLGTTYSSTRVRRESVNYGADYDDDYVAPTTTTTVRRERRSYY